MINKCPPWIKYITIDDMPNDDLRTLAEKVGVEKTVETILELPGIAFTIPKKPFRAAKEQYIMDNYDGTKYCLNKLALACDLTQKQVYKIIKKNLAKQRIQKEKV